MAVNTHLVSVTEDIVIKEVKKLPYRTAPWWYLHWRAVLAELVSTTLLLFLGCMTCIPLDGVNTNPPLYTPLGFGFVVLFNIQAFGHISGAHMNPSVTLAAVIWGIMPVNLGVAYAVSQCIGAILGYGILMELLPSDSLSGGICISQPHLKHTVNQALLVEVLLTAALIFMVCSVWDPVNEEKKETNSLKFGLTVSGLAIAGGPLNGGSMNPARSLGPAIWTGRWTSHWIYWVGPLIGGAMAAIFYKHVWTKVEKINHPKVLSLTADLNSEV